MRLRWLLGGMMLELMLGGGGRDGVDGDGVAEFGDVEESLEERARSEGYDDVDAARTEQAEDLAHHLAMSIKEVESHVT